MNLLELTLSVYGTDGKVIPPRTKKTSPRLVTIKPKGKQPFQKILPSKAYVEWEAAALRAVKGMLYEAITCPVNCRAIFYRDRLSGDAVGFYQALADFLQKAGFVVNDVLIVSWDGTRLAKDVAEPRIELILETAE